MSDWIERFEAFVETSEKCWIWRGHIGPGGYGRMMVSGQRIQAHRLSYALHYGDLPADAHICHHCDNPPCVNPAHLYAGDPITNTRDKFARGRQPIRRGESVGTAVLDEHQVLQIRVLASRRSMRQKDIGALFGITGAQVSNIHTRKQWSHI